MSIYPQEYSIVRRESDERLPCANEDGEATVGQLMIRVDKVASQEVEHWHFSCALLNQLIFEDVLVRLARRFKGRLRY